MIVSKLWTEEWAHTPFDTETLCDRLTMAGLEVDSVSPVCGTVQKVVVGHVLECVDHPDSDHLHVAKVDVGSEVLQIVCGAPNCRQGLKVCTALVGARVGDIEIKKATLRGVESSGMLCSYKELGMAEESDGICELPPDAPVGTDIREYLHLDDAAIDIELTTNRADCLSILGVAREAAVLARTELKDSTVANVPAVSSETFSVTVEDKKACPRYLARIIRNVNQQAKSPLWMTERLRRCGVRAVSPIVDVTNYVMLELGQPLHSFDLDKLQGGICVRKARNGEKLTVLSGETLNLTEDTLLITDAKGPVALAGVFGGLQSGISDQTCNVLLESAFFAPEAIKGRARHYGLDTDAARRFERGVDFMMQRRAIERATELLLQIAGGVPGPVTEALSEADLPKRGEVKLRRQRLEQILGEKVPDSDVTDILTRLGLKPECTADGWVAVAPSFRFDIEIEEDLIEEVGRIYGYDRIPNTTAVSDLRMTACPERLTGEDNVKRALCDCGYTEAVTYSFTDPAALMQFTEGKPVMLKDPISPEMSAMRTTLLPSLLLAARYNLNRQQRRVRLFETGLRYVPDAKAENGVRQEKMLAAIAVGDAEEENWAYAGRAVDFYDIKGDLERVLRLTAGAADFTFVPTGVSWLHPGQGADVLSGGRVVGSVGVLHPLVQKALNLRARACVFEIELQALANRQIPVFRALSKFPSVRRDLAFVLPEQHTVEALVKVVRGTAGALLRDLMVFDVFADGTLKGARSVALGLVLQDETRTLADAAVEELIGRIVGAAESELGAALRS